MGMRTFMVPPSGVRGTLAENVVINIWRNLLAIASVAYFVLSEVGKLGDKLFFLIVFAVSAHNIRLYWLYFRKKRTAKNSDTDSWPLL